MLKLVIDIWNKFSKDFPNSKRISIPSLLMENEKRIKKVADEKLALAFGILDEGIQAIYHLFELNNKNIKKENESYINRAFWILQARQLNLLLAFRNLINCGFENASRIILRSLLEINQMTLIVLVDKEFEYDFFKDVSEDESIKLSEFEFWRENVGYGKIHFRYRKVLEIADLTDTEINSFIKSKKEILAHLSSSVHNSFSDALYSIMPPVLSHPGYLRVNPLGEHSVFTGHTCANVIQEIHMFLYIFIKLTTDGKISDTIRNYDQNMLSSFFTSALVFQELYATFESKLKLPWDELFPDIDQ